MTANVLYRIPVPDEERLQDPGQNVRELPALLNTTLVSVSGEAEEYPKKPFFLRYKNWAPRSGIYPRKCHGMFHRDICILGIGDIHKAVQDIGLFANKFHLTFERPGLDCLESWLNERTWDQYLSNATVDVSYYRQLDQVKYQYRPDVKYNLEYS